ncbi:MAG: ExeM/NucH family extracellular endonuclease, partial [Anaerolineae bacterium]
GTGGQYTDTGDAGTDHALVNNAGEAPVNYTSVGGELGFSSYYYNTRGDVGLTDGDWVGVTSFTGVVGSYPDGSQGFQMSDADGAMRTTLDTVDLTAYPQASVFVQYFVQATGWESNDELRIWVVVDGGAEIDLVNTAGSDIDDLGIEGAWQTAIQNLSGYTEATLHFQLDSNSSSETVYFDNVFFTDTVLSVGSTEATVNGTFENGGRDSSDWYFNVQGDDDSYRAWGAADFDAPSLGLMTPIDDIMEFELRLTQANAFFTNDGIVGFWVSEDTTTAIGPGSGLAWVATADQDGLGTQLQPRTFLGTGTFTETGNGDTDTYDLTALPGYAAIKPYLIDQINTGGTIRIIVAPTDTDTAVAATWAGYSSFSYDGPVLAVQASSDPSKLPPRVTDTAPPDGATGVSLDTNVVLDFSESVDIAAGALTLECPAGTAQPFSTSPALPATDVMSVMITPDALLPPGTTCTVTAAATGITDRDGTPDELDGNADGTGGDDYVFSFTTIDCGAPATLIHDIQGDGPASPEDGNVHTVEGIVVGDFQRIVGNNQLSGFFVQEETSDWDVDPDTSEGIYVYEGGGSLLDVAVGDKVRLTAEVDEYYDLTELKNLTELGRCDSGLPTAAVPVALPESVDGELEAYEGMLVGILNDMTVAQNYFLGRYGQMTLSATGRMFQPTNQFLPGSPQAIALADANARSLLILDDGMDVSSCGDNPVPVPYLGPPPPDVIRAGDRVSDLVGVLDYGKINSGNPCWDQGTFNRDYRLHPTQAPVFTPVNLRTPAPEDVGGDLKVASFNVLNYFTTLDTGPDVCGPTGGQGCRGADSASEFTRQRDKIVEAMCAIDADIFGLMELENQNPANDPDPLDGIDNYVLRDLVDALNDPASPCPERWYGFTDSPAVGTDAIRVGIIYKTRSLKSVGRAVLDDPGFTDPNALGDQQSRPAIAETFEDDSGERFTVVVNHLKSKGSPCGPGDDDPVQGNCNDTRAKGAAYLINWLTGDPTGSGDPDFLVIGDLNAYAMEDPIMAFLGADFTDLLRANQGKTAYTYIFDGQSGYLDHALANPEMYWQVTGATDWHINADEPPVIDYDEDFNPPGYYSPNAYRASDHDPVIVGLRLWGIAVGGATVPFALPAALQPRVVLLVVS